MESLRKALTLVSILPRRPQEFNDRAVQGVELRLDRLFRSRPDYHAASWESLIQDMEEYFGRVVDILSEPALGDIEERVRQRLKNMEHTALFSLTWFTPIYSAGHNLARCCYLACRLLQPSIVLETGVAYGVTSAYILRALEENGQGRLYSVELPRPGRKANEFVGIAIPEGLKGRWNLYHGFSKRVLPKLLREVGSVDIFMQDSCHNYRCMKREFDAVWPCMRTGGMIIVDDIQENSSFSELQERGLAFQRVVEQADKQSLFGVAVIK